MSCDRVSLKWKFSLQIFFKVADACEAGAGPCARVVGEVDQLHDGVVNAASS